MFAKRLVNRAWSFHSLRHIISCDNACQWWIHKTTNRWGILAKGHLLNHWFCIWSIAKKIELLISMERVKYSSKSSKNNSQTGDNKKCSLLKSKRTLLKGNMTSLSSSTIRLLKWSRVVICYICMFLQTLFTTCH